MKRPEQHITDSEADAIFRAVFAEWSINPSERDYGWDYVVEVFRNGESTGLQFNVQLKGSRHTEYSADGSFLSQKLEIDSADYLARQLRLPTFLIHADVEAKKLFWSAIQLDQRVLQLLDQGEAKSLTVRVPTTNVLPANIDHFARDLAAAQMLVVSRILMQTTPFEFAEAMRSQPIEQTSRIAEDLHEKGYTLQLDAAFVKRKSGDYAGAVEAIRKVAASAGASGYVEIQFNAVLQARDLEWLLIQKSDAPQAQAADNKLETALELCRIAKRKPRHLYLFAQITRRAAELGVEAHKTFGLLMSWRAHTLSGNDPIWVAVLSYRLYQSLLSTHRKYNQSLRLARAAAKSRFRWVISRPIVDIAMAIGTLAGVLKSCDFKEVAEQYHQSAFDLLKFSAAIATENKSIDELYNAVAYANTLELNVDGEIHRWVRSVVDQWQVDSQYRQNAEQLIRNRIDRRNGLKFAGDIVTTPRQVLHNILTSMGLDPTVEPWVSHIELALKDDDPTRVLVGCEHKWVTAHPSADPALTRLALERANPKIIGCNLHQYKSWGRELDNIDQAFKGKYCDECPDRVPRPEGWTFFGEPFS